MNNAEQQLHKVAELGEEFLRLMREGKSPSLDDYQARYPELAGELKDFIEAVQIVEQIKPGSAISCEPAPYVGNPDAPKLQDYRIIRELGRGGMGRVYEAEQLSLNRRVALKILPPEHSKNSISVERFLREAKSAAALHHTNIIPVFDVGSEGGVHFYAMQLITGSSLDEVIAQVLRIRMSRKQKDSSKSLVDDSRTQQNFPTHAIGSRETAPTIDLATRDKPADLQRGQERSGIGNPTSETISNALAGEDTETLRNQKRWHYYRKVARIGAQVADALKYSHSHNIIHRDIKPANLMMDLSGNVWVADFGLAKKEDDGLTKTGDVVGTLRYMSPERFEGTCDEKSDVYALGMVLYEMLALKPAFYASGQLSLLEKIRRADPVSLPHHDPVIPRDLATIVHKAIEKEPERRYRTAGLLLDDLNRFVDGRPIHARTVSSYEKAMIWAKRNPVVASLTSALVVLLLGTLVGSVIAASQFRTMAFENKELALDAKRAAKTAMDEKANAQRAAAKATEMSDLNERNLYYAEMKLALDASSDPIGVRLSKDMLSRWNPQENPQLIADRRGWEWFFIDSVINPQSTVVECGVSHASYGLDFSPDGEYLCWSFNNQAFVADFPDFKTRKVLSEHRTWIYDLAFSPDGTKVVTASEDCSAVVWDWRQQKVSKKLPFASTVGALVFSDDGKYLAIQAFDRGDPKGCLHLFETENWEQIRRFEQVNGNDIYNIDFDPSFGKLIANAKHDTMVVDVQSGETLIKKSLHDGQVVGYDWHPTKPVVASAARDGQILLWNLEDDTKQVVAKSEIREFSGIAWSPDGQRLAFGNWDRGVRVVHPFADGPETRLYGHTERVQAVSWHPTENLMASIASDGTVRIWELDIPNAVTVIQPEKPGHSIENRVAWNSDGTRLAVSAFNVVRIHDVTTGEIINAKLSPMEAIGTSVYWPRQGDGFVSVYWCDVRFWNADCLTTRKTIQKSMEQVWKKGNVHPTKPLLIMAETNRRVDVWQLMTLDLVTGETKIMSEKRDGQFQAGPFWSPDGSKIAFIAAGVFEIYDVEKDRFSSSLDSRELLSHSACWGKDSNSIAVCGRNGKVLVKDVKSGDVIAVMNGHHHTVLAMDYQPNGNRLATGSRDGTVRIWDTVSHEQTVVLESSTVVVDLAWSPCGQRLAYICSDGVASILDASVGYRRTSEFDLVNEFTRPAAKISRMDR